MVISVIVGSIRQGRFGERPAKWIFQDLQNRDGVETRLLDLRGCGRSDQITKARQRLCARRRR